MGGFHVRWSPTSASRIPDVLPRKSKKRLSSHHRSQAGHDSCPRRGGRLLRAVLSHRRVVQHPLGELFRRHPGLGHRARRGIPGCTGEQQVGSTCQLEEAGKCSHACVCHARAACTRFRAEQGTIARETYALFCPHFHDAQCHIPALLGMLALGVLIENVPGNVLRGCVGELQWRGMSGMGERGRRNGILYPRAPM